MNTRLKGGQLIQGPPANSSSTNKVSQGHQANGSTTTKFGQGHQANGSTITKVGQGHQANGSTTTKVCQGHQANGSTMTKVGQGHHVNGSTTAKANQLAQSLKQSNSDQGFQETKGISNQHPLVVLLMINLVYFRCNSVCVSVFMTRLLFFLYLWWFTLVLHGHETLRY